MSQNNIKFEKELFANFAEPIINLIEDSSVTEIYIDSYDRISYMRDGLVKNHDQHFDDAVGFMRLCDLLVKDHRASSLGDTNYFSFNSNEGHRFSIHTPDIRTNFGSYTMTIRLFRALDMTVDRMIELGAFTQYQFDQIVGYMARGKNILICGKPNSGKTTIMRCLLNKIESDNSPRFIFLEDPKELNLDYSLGFEIEVNHREAGSASNALRFCLRNSPQVMVLGEIIDPDVARTFLESIEAGFSGAISTIHSKNASVATSRLATLASKGSTVTRSDWLEAANSTIDLVVYVSFDQITGKRHISEMYDVQEDAMLDMG